MNVAINFLREHPDANLFHTTEENLKKIVDPVRSALKIYNVEISKLAEEHEIEEFNKEKQEISKILETDLLWVSGLNRPFLFL